jgi:hypothetical protein
MDHQMTLESTSTIGIRTLRVTLLDTQLHGGLDSTLQEMEAMDVNLGILMETKVTSRIYTQHLSGFSVVASNAHRGHQGRIVFFWRANKMYKVRDWHICGPNVLFFVIVMGSQHFYVVGCYILPTDLNTLPQVKQALNECLKGHTPLLIGDLNVKLHAPRDERDKQIAEVVEDICGLTDLSKHFRQQSCGHTRGRWTWRMRRGRRWVTSQCGYFLGRATDRRKFCSICLRTPFNHNLDHCAIITEIRAGSKTKMTAYHK